MSAATSSPYDRPGQDRVMQDRVIAQQRAHEPSMEEILASIRRIIADDQRPTVRAEPQSAPSLAPDRPANLDEAGQNQRTAVCGAISPAFQADSSRKVDAAVSRRSDGNRVIPVGPALCS